MKNLIVNADDFGLHSQINRAVSTGHTIGCLTSASLMAMGGAFDEAVAFALKTPSLGVGVHLTLVAERPVLSPDKVGSLVDARGNFAAAHTAFIRRYMRGELQLSEVYAELSAQIERILETGVAVSHLDSHQHLHVLPKITEICIELAKKYQIKAMRIPAESYCFTGGYRTDLKRWVGKCGLTFLAERARRRLKREPIAIPAHFFGMLAGGHMTESYVKNILVSLPEGASEIMLHPACSTAALQEIYHWAYRWEEEYNALVSPAILELIRTEQITLHSFRELSYE